MNPVTIILGILMFAAVTAFLYILGLRKSLTQEQDLEEQLLGKSANRIIKYLKKNGYASRRKITELIKNTSSGFFWSRKKAKISDPEKFSKTLIEYMISKQLIQYSAQKGYKLTK